MGLVYVIEPDVAIRDALKTLIASVNLPVKGYKDAAAFLRATGCAPQGCILAEAEMPGLNGLALLNKLRKHDSKASVLLLADRADPEFIQRAVAAGACAVIEKPITNDDVVPLILASFEQKGNGYHREQLRRMRPMA